LFCLLAHFFIDFSLLVFLFGLATETFMFDSFFFD